MKKTIDFTEGKPFNLLLSFTLPAIAGNLLSQFYSITDSIIVGRYLGQSALAAIGVCMPVILLVATLIIGLNIGVSILISQAFGRKDFEGIKKIFINSIYLASLICLFVFVLGPILTRPILQLMKTPEGPLNQAASYMKINFVTTIFPMLYYLFNNVFRGLGDSMTALYCLIISVICNIFLDILFVATFNWGVAGSAWATAISQCLSVLFASFMLFKKFSYMRPKKGDFKPEFKIISAVAKLAIPIAVQTSFNNLGNIIVQSCINGFGEAVMAAYTAAGRLGGLALMPLESVAGSLSVYTGQNSAKKETKRVKDGMKAAFSLDFCFHIVISLILIVFGKSLTKLFLKDATTDIMNPAYSYLMIVGVSGILYGLMSMFHEVLKGIGQPKHSMIGGFMQLGTKVIVAIIGAKLINLNIVWMAWPLSFMVGTIYPYIKYKQIFNGGDLGE